MNGKPLVVKRLKRLEEVEGCHLLFISRSENKRLPKLMQLVSNHHVLTVGDVEGFAKLGVIVSFLIENESVRFVINLKAAERAGLKISSRLLRIAKLVEGTH